MEGRFSSRPAPVLGAGVAGHACVVRVNPTKAHPRCDNGGASQCGRVSPNLLPAVDLSGECHPGLAHSSQPGYQSWVCKRASGELGTGQTTDGLREASGPFASTGGPEPPATAPDAHVRSGARRASRDLGTAAAGVAGTSDGTGDHRAAGR